MRHLTFLFSLLIFPYLSHSQDYHSLEFNSDNGLYNSSIDGKTFFNSLGYINDNQKQKIINTLGNSNSFYIDLNNTMTFTHKKGFSLSFGNHLTSYGQFNKELVRLAMYGNTAFSGESNSLLPVNANLFHYSDITFGFNVNDNLKSSVSFIAGHQFIQGEFSRFDFSMGENGEEISYDLILDGIEASNYQDILSSRGNSEKSTRKELFKTYGRGVSFGFDYSGEIFDGNYDISVKELGFIIWDDNSHVHNIDASDLIVPIEVSDFTEIESSSFTAELDSLRGLNDPYNDSYYFSLPTRINGAFNKLISSDYFDSYTLTLEHRFNIYDSPRLALDIHKVYKKHQLALGYHTGGMEQNGFQFKYNYLAENFHFQLFTRQANIINQMSMYGLHVGVGLKFMFGKTKSESSSETKLGE